MRNLEPGQAQVGMMVRSEGWDGGTFYGTITRIVPITVEWPLKPGTQGIYIDTLRHVVAETQVQPVEAWHCPQCQQVTPTEVYRRGDPQPTGLPDTDMDAALAVRPAFAYCAVCGLDRDAEW